MADQNGEPVTGHRAQTSLQHPARGTIWTNTDDVFKQADRQVSELEEMMQPKAKAGSNGIVLCQNDKELKTWLTQWCITQDDVLQQMGMVADKRSKLDMRRSRGVHKVAASTQHFLAQMGELSTNYSGLMDAIGSAAGPYGEAANAGFRALSCLFLAATNKTGNEALITSRLEEINSFFPRINTLRSIYEEDTRIGILVALIHLDIVRFADKAARFFSNPWRRVLGLLVPPSLKTDPTYESMKTRLVELRSWASLNLHQNAMDTLKKTEKLNEAAASAKGQLRELQDQLRLASVDLGKTQFQVEQATRQLEDISRIVRMQEEQHQKQMLGTLKDDLQIDNSSINFSVSECFDSTSRILETLRLDHRHESEPSIMPRESLESDKVFQKWISGSQKLLVIGGVTNQEMMGLAWITPAILGLALTWSEESTNTLAFFTGSPQGYQHRQQWRSFTDMLLGLVWEVARQVPSILQEDRIREATKTLSKDCSKWWLLGDVKSMGKAVGRVVAAASVKGKLHLVIDRLDRIEGAVERYGEMVECLVSLAAEAPNSKVLITWSVTDNRRSMEDYLESLSDDLLVNIRLDSSFYYD